MFLVWLTHLSFSGFLVGLGHIAPVEVKRVSLLGSLSK